jgi:transcriptional regulator with XRE-family HTH domain
MPRARARRGFYPDLASYFAETGATQAAVASLVDSTQAHLSRIAAGEVNPRPGLAARIAHVCKVPLDSFTRVYLARQQEKRAASREQAAAPR